MRDNSDAKTLLRNYVSKWQFLIGEYEQVKAGAHPQFRFVRDFYKFHNTNRQTFLKYYNRLAESEGDLAALLPQKRGPKWKAKRPDAFVEQLIIEHRELGNSRYDIFAILQSTLGPDTPSASTIYRVLRKHGMNRLKPPQKANKRKIIKRLAGELGHIDCHHLGRDMIAGDDRKRYLVCLLDDCTRVAWAKVVDDVTALTVMFASLEIINRLHSRYRIRFAEVMSDNGSEFASKKHTRTHPFERLLLELGIKHRYTRPYRPQTNGKVERFWRTLNEDLIEYTVFDSVAHFQTELEQYLLYYNEHRPHQALGAKTPQQMNQNCQRIGEPLQERQIACPPLWQKRALNSELRLSWLPHGCW